MNFFIYDPNEILSKLKLPSKKNNFFIYKKAKLHPYATSIYSGFINDIKKINNNPIEKSDFALVPIGINIPALEQIEDYNDIFIEIKDNLKHYKNFPEKHVFFLAGDNSSWIHEFPIGFYASSSIENSSLTMFYSSDIFCIKNVNNIKNISSKIDIVFQGYNNNNIRAEMIKYFLNQKKYKCILKENNKYFESYDLETKKQLQETWLNLLTTTDFVLCPKGNGLGSIRFYETLYYGKIPILYGDKYKLPLTKEIQYEKFTVRIPENDIKNSNNYIENFLQNNDLQTAKNKARKTWENYFSNQNFKFFLERSLKDVKLKFNLLL